MQNERIHWIDIARGIGIVFIIYAHVLGSHDYRYLFYAFHIPLFFFLSGILHKKDISFITFLKKSAKRLLVPYFIFAFIMYSLWFFNLKNHNLSPEIIRQFFSIFYGNSNNGLMGFNDILWFLPTLFATRIFFAIIAKTFEKIKSIILVLLFFSIFGYLFSIFASAIKFPFGIETAFSAVVFYGAGFLWQNFDKVKGITLKYKYLLFPAFLILGSILSTIDFQNSGQQIDMRLNHLNNYFFFYINAFLGIITWISFSMILSKNRLLENFGRNSLVLFAWHPTVFFYLDRFTNIFHQTNFAIIIFIPLICTIISISVILFVDSIINRMRLTCRRMRF